MVFNISGLLSLESTKNAVVLVEGENHNDIIKGIDLIDNFADVGDKGGQLVLIRNADVSFIDNCIQRIKDAGAYGVLAKMPSEELKEACRKAGISLVALPENGDELKIVQETGRYIIDEYKKREEFIRSCYNSFYNDEFGTDVDEILEKLSDMLDTVVVAYYAGGRVGSTGGIEIAGDEYVTEGEEDGRQTITAAGITMKGVIIPFKVFNRIYGRLFIKTDHEITEPEIYIIKGAMTAVTMAMTREFAVTEIEQKMKNELLNDLITGDIRSESSILIRAEDLGWNISKPSIAVICKLNIVGPKNKNEIISVHSRVKQALAHLMDEKYGEGEHWIIGAAGDTVNILWPIDTGKNYAGNCEDIREVLTRLFENEHDKYGMVGFTGGIGSETLDVFGIKKSFDDAISAIKYGYMTGSGHRIYDISGIGIYRFIGKIGSREDLISFIPSSLRRLVEYDSASKNVLVDTLDVYLTCDCNINKASQQLDIHYKTLVYRIGRIKEIMELESIEGDVRLEIQLALKILRMLEKTEK